MKKNIHLVLIDPQNDFCDLPADWQGMDAIGGARIAPALPVAGAHADMLRVAGMIRDGADGIGAITVTLDSHHRLDIAHPTFWQAGEGDCQAVPPFTTITAAQVRAGGYRPRDPAALPRALAYLEALEQRGRYALMVWPVHCEIGSWGHNVHAAVRDAYNVWEERRLQVVQKVAKGSNPWTEHYSAIQAEVPDPADPATALNQPLVDRLDQSDLIVIAGEASSHCVRATTEDIVDNLPSRRADKVVLLTDCMSPVAGFEAQHRTFLEGMAARGVQLRSSDDMRATLAQNA